MARFGAFFLALAGFTAMVNARAIDTRAAEDESLLADAPKYFISFGDSYSQTGFDINGDKPNPSNPLGNPALPGWTASGGLDWVGFMVTQFNKTQVYSYNFAYGGATTDAALIPPYTSTVKSFIDQVTEFSNNLASKPSWAPWTSQNTVVGVWMGVNDVGNAFWMTNVEDLLGKVLNQYFAQIQILYNAGVRNFALLTVPPTDKTPAFLNNGEASNDLVRAAIKIYNNLVTTKMAAFQSANKGVTSWIVDTQAPFNEALNNPTRYGAPDATCYNSDGTSCLWFNDYHPGVQIQKLVADSVSRIVGGQWFKTGSALSGVGSVKRTQSSMISQDS